jgi:hypothetical protein
MLAAIHVGKFEWFSEQNTANQNIREILLLFDLKSHTLSLSKDIMWILSHIAGPHMKTCYRTNLHKLLSLYFP